MDWNLVCYRAGAAALVIGVLGLLYVVIEVVRIDDVRIEL